MSEVKPAPGAASPHLQTKAETSNQTSPDLDDDGKDLKDLPKEDTTGGFIRVWPRTVSISMAQVRDMTCAYQYWRL